MSERLINDGAGAREVTLRIGAACRFDGRPWNRSLRCWFGDDRTMRWMFTPYGRGTVSELTSKSQRPFWRVIGQCGTGFLYRPVAASRPVRLVHRLPQQPGNPAEFEWMGATINCDAETEQIGQAATKRRLQQGKASAPPGVHMLLATCADVPQAVRFITDPEAPLEFTGNMLLADRQGNAAILESVGTYQQVIRCEPGKPFYSIGNYPHRRADGRFQIGPNWGWAANTMLRERFVQSLLEPRRGQVSLEEAFMIMATRAEPGGMCQHTFDNVATLYSTCAAIAVTRNGDLYISHGPPRQVEYVRYRLDDEAGE